MAGERIKVKILLPCRNSVTLAWFRPGDEVELAPVEISTLPLESYEIISRTQARTTRVKEPAHRRSKKK